MKRLSILTFTVLAICSVSLAQSQKHILSFDKLFPRSKQHRMGLHKLTAEEKEALHSHVEMLFIAAVKAMSEKASSGGTYAGIGSGHWIQKNIDSGAFILLEDDSLWEVDPLDRIDSSLWLPISEITVIESSGGSPGYDYLLINTDDGEKVHAKFIGNK